MRYNSEALLGRFSLRVLHTSDWHLGHTLHDLDRWREHDAFLDWLVEVLGEHSIDAMLLTGDVFDSANPSARSTQRWFSFLAGLRRRYPSLDLIVVGGNHDSAARMDAPRPILESMNIHILGGLPRHADGAVRLEDVIVPITGPDGEVGGWVAAVPFLRPGDLPRVTSAEATAEGRLVAGMRTLYQQLIGSLQERRQPGQAAIVTGHCLMAGARLSEHSERKIQGGNHDELPVDVFSDDLTYVALGHLHLAQAVGRETVRYAGSPLPLSMAETNYRHEVRILQIDDGVVTSSGYQRKSRRPSRW
jgi:exonuclease SbcD